MGSSEIAGNQRYMPCSKAEAQFSSPRVKRPSPEGGAAAHLHATWKRPSAPSSGRLLGPSGFKSSLESVVGCSPHKPVRQGETPLRRDTGLFCEECVERLGIFREEALRVLSAGHYSTSDPKLSALLYESVQTPALSDVTGRCDVCFAHLSQLKREAVRMLLTTERAIWQAPVPTNVPPGHPAVGAYTLPRACSSLTPGPSSHQRTGNLETGSWLRETPRVEALRTPSSKKAVSTSMTSQDAVKKKKENDKATSSGTVLCHFGSPLPFNPSKVSTLLPSGTSAAVSFIVRAVQKLNLTSRRRKQHSENGCSRYPTNFSGLLQKSPPPTPSNLLQSASKGRDVPDPGKVKVMLRVSPSQTSDTPQSHALRLDLRRRQITVLEPTPQNTARSAAGLSFTPKTFTFDAAFGPESSQTEVCERSLFDVLQSVVAGADGCILCLGQSNVGTSYTMIGCDDSTPSLGIIPCAISWLFKIINKKKDRTWANISVSVSAVEVCAESEVIRDLLSDVDSVKLGDSKITPESNVYLLEDPVCGIQLRNNSLISAPTSERAAFLLDAALASRSTRKTGCGGTFQHCCHMFYTLHVVQKHIESSPKSGMYVDQSKLSLIDLGSCTKEKNKSNAAACLVDLGNVITAKLNGNVLYKRSKLAMLMQESLNNINCCTTIVAHVSNSDQDHLETLCTIQVVSRIRRLQNKSKKSVSSSPGGRTLSKEKKRSDSTRLRTFRSVGTLHHGMSLPHLFDDLEDHFWSGKSYDSLVSVHPTGYVLSEKEGRGNQEFVPIVPSLQRSKTELQTPFSLKRCDPLQSTSQNLCSPKKETKRQFTQPKTLGFGIPDWECLKCNTFAELQDRLGCIDGNEVVGMHSCKDQPASTLTKSQSPSIKPVKIPPKQPEIQGSPQIKDLHDKAQGNVTQRDTPVNSEYMNYRESPVKTSYKNVPPCSPRPDIISSSIQAVQSTVPKCMTETMEKDHSFSLPEEQLPSDDSTLPPDIRISPVGKSSSSSLSAGLESPVSLPVPQNEVVPQYPSENQREMKATITVTVQQPLDLNGHDELVYSVVEEVTISGAISRAKTSKLSCITDAQSFDSLASESQPVRIISSIEEEQTNPVSQAQALDQTCKTSSIMSGSKALPLPQTFVVNSLTKEMVSPHCDKGSEESQAKSQNIVKDVSVVPEAFEPTTYCEATRVMKYSCDNKPEEKATKRKCKQGNDRHFCETSAIFSSVKEPPENPFSSYSAHSTSSPTRAWPSLDNHHEYTDSFIDWKTEHFYCPKETLEQKESSSKEWVKDIKAMSSVQISKKDSPKKRNGHPQAIMTHCIDQPTSSNKFNKANIQSPILEESSRLFSAKLEQLANRTRSLGKGLQNSLERVDRGHTSPRVERRYQEKGHCKVLGSNERVDRGHTSPRLERRYQEKGHCKVLGSSESFNLDYTSAQATKMTSPALSRSFEEDLTTSWAGHSVRRMPKFFPMHDVEESDITQPSRLDQSKMPAASKVVSSPKVSRMAGTIPKNSCVSPRSIKHSRSSSLSPDGFSFNHFSWSSQSLSRKQENFFSKSCNRILNERVELLRTSGDSLSSSSQSSLDIDELEDTRGKIKLPVCALPSPYSQITAPRKPKHCSGHASDNTSVLSGELPPAMCKTALLYNRNSMVSSGYESMVRDSEATCSSTSVHDSISDQSCFFSPGRGARSSKKRNNSSSFQRRPSQVTLLSLRRSASGSKIRWVDRGTSDSYEIKVYEIENVDGLQKRGEAGHKNVICFSAKLKFLEHRQQRIAEVRAKYNALKRELELSKQHLMVDQGKWTREFDLWQTFEVDSLEHLEALELITQRLESQVNRCKARVMMVTCFDAAPKRRQKKRRRLRGDYKRLMRK